MCPALALNLPGKGLIGSELSKQEKEGPKAEQLLILDTYFRKNPEFAMKNGIDTCTLICMK